MPTQRRLGGGIDLQTYVCEELKTEEGDLDSWAWRVVTLLRLVVGPSTTRTTWPATYTVTLFLLLLRISSDSKRS